MSSNCAPGLVPEDRLNPGRPIKAQTLLCFCLHPCASPGLVPALSAPHAVQKLHACEVILPFFWWKYDTSNTQSIMADDDFTSGDSGASATYPVQCSSLRKNGFVMLKGHPCKIVDMTTSKTGKHGHAKVHLTGLDIFTQKKYEDICPSTHNMDVPNVTRKDYQVVDLAEGYLTLMDDGGETREDLKVPEGDLGKDIEKRVASGENFMVSVMKAIDDEHVVGIKNMTS